MFPGNIASVWHAGLHASEVQESLEAAKFEMRGDHPVKAAVRDRLGV
jgi:hypothetical protein